jgi:hypothetical protein
MKKAVYGEVTNQVGRSEGKIGDIYVLLEKSIPGNRVVNISHQALSQSYKHL